MQRKQIITQIISECRDSGDANRYIDYTLPSQSILDYTCKKVLKSVPMMENSCALLSALWAIYLNDFYKIPAVVVLGDFKVDGNTLYECSKKPEEPQSSGDIVECKFQGHCWVEIDNYICDLSIFMTAQSNKHFLEHLIQKFGYNHINGIVIKHDKLPVVVEYNPKYVFN